MSFEIDALFGDNFLIARIIPFSDTGLKEELPSSKCIFITLQLSLFLSD